MINRKRFLELMEKRLDKNCSEKEQTELDAYFLAYGQQVFESGEEQKTKRRIYQQIKEELMKSEERQIPRFNRKALLRFAAAVAILCTLGITSYFWSSQQQPKMVTVLTALGEKKQVLLPDSSQVILNAGSSITYPEFFIGNTREVSMKGELFFKVVHRSQQPFIVSTENLKTQVLGTSFNIKSYDDNPNIRISLATGAIRISNAVKVIATLKPNEQLNFDKLSGTYRMENENTYTNDMAWINNIIKLNDHSLSETLLIVERWFNVKLHLNKENISEQKITGKFTNPSLEDIISSLELLTGTKITFEKQVQPEKPLKQ